MYTICDIHKEFWEQSNKLSIGEFLTNKNGTMVLTRVMGGWIYETCNYNGESKTTTFIPLPPIAGV